MKKPAKYLFHKTSGQGGSNGAVWPIGTELEIEIIGPRIRCNAKVADNDKFGEAIVEAISGKLLGRRFNSSEYILKRVFSKGKISPITLLRK